MGQKVQGKKNLLKQQRANQIYKFIIFYWKKQSIVPIQKKYSVNYSNKQMLKPQLLF